MSRAFSSQEDEARYLAQVKTELDAASTKEAVVDIWRKYYLVVGHKKLGRLLLGQTVDKAMRVSRIHGE